MRRHKLSLFLDSGAFSAWSKGAPVDINDYIQFIKEYEPYIEYYAVLDDISDPVVTMRNQAIMEDAGLHPIPCFHYGEDISYLEHYIVNGHTFIALGGMVPISTKDLRPWLDYIFKDYICNKDTGIPDIKVHGFGMTNHDLMMRYPWYCMTDEDHEVLTKHGWKSRSELSIGEHILAFDNGKSVWQPIQAIPTFNVNKAQLIHAHNRAFDATITNNHNWVVCDQASRGKDWQFKQTQEWNTRHCIPRVGQYTFPQSSPYTNEQVELLAWFWTDGSIKARARYNQDSVCIYQSKTANKKKHDHILKALKNSGAEFCSTPDKRNGVVCFEIYGKMGQFLLSTFPQKQIPLEFVLSLTKEQTQLFIKCSMQADGTKTSLVHRQGRAIVVQRPIKKLNLESLRIAYLLLGVPTTIFNTKTGGKGLQVSSVDYVYINKLVKETIDYSGLIWCVQVPSRAFFVRCKDKIYVTGNSVDSTSWAMAGRHGAIMVPRSTQGQYDYTKRPHLVDVSNKSSAIQHIGKHYANYTPNLQAYILSYLHAKGYALGESTVKHVDDGYVLQEHERWFSRKQLTVEVILQEGVINNYRFRDEVNIKFYQDFEAHLPEWPWPFKLKTSKRFGR